ncbi:hypothetical protein AB0M94_37340 [Streptomyces xanthochromogenes]|uniref:hypothetical protein n=1 Tax=Streptomyces xanthochromogenes TaxID=67384 RepID=UPI00342E43D1
MNRQLPPDGYKARDSKWRSSFRRSRPRRSSLGRCGSGPRSEGCRPGAPALAPARATAAAPDAQPAAAGAQPAAENPSVPPAGAPAATPAPTAAEPAPAAAARSDGTRVLPAVPDGPAGERWFTHTPNLASTHPNFTQQARSTVFLDASSGLLVHRDRTLQLALGSSSAGEILDAVFNAVSEGVERIYITGGDPWHRDAARHPCLKDAVAAWLNAPAPGWRTDTGRGKVCLAGHFVHPATRSAATSAPAATRAATAAGMSNCGRWGSGSTWTAPARPPCATRCACCGGYCARTGRRGRDGLALADRP